MLAKFKATIGVGLLLPGAVNGQAKRPEPKCADVRVVKPDVLSADSTLARTVLYAKHGTYRAPEDLVKGGAALRLIRVENYSDGIVVVGVRIEGRLTSASIRPGNHHTLHMTDGSAFTLEDLELLVAASGGVQVQYVYAAGLAQEDFMPKPAERPAEKKRGDVV
jgi:hypothetical protein